MPFVVSTMGTLNPVALLYKAYNFYNTFALNEHIAAICIEVIEAYLRNTANGHTKEDADRVRKCFVDMRAVGVATTLGYAHHNSGDTMSTVMIMGLHTTMNGAYPIEVGDEIMWYWDFEAAVLKTGACPFCRSKVDIHGERDAAKTALAGVPASVSQA